MTTYVAYDAAEAKQVYATDWNSDAPRVWAGQTRLTLVVGGALLSWAAIAIGILSIVF